MFSRLVPTLRAIGRNCIIDGEIAAPDENGVTCVDRFSEIIVTEPGRLALFAFEICFGSMGRTGGQGRCWSARRG